MNRATRLEERQASSAVNARTGAVPFSEEMFTRLGDTYRRIRNTLPILLEFFHEASTRCFTFDS
jgi:hypothetical protein